MRRGPTPRAPQPWSTGSRLPKYSCTVTRAAIESTRSAVTACAAYVSDIISASGRLWSPARSGASAARCGHCGVSRAWRSGTYSYALMPYAVTDSENVAIDYSTEEHHWRKRWHRVGRLLLEIANRDRPRPSTSCIQICNHGCRGKRPRTFKFQICQTSSPVFRRSIAAPTPRVERRSRAQQTLLCTVTLRRVCDVRLLRHGDVSGGNSILNSMLVRLGTMVHIMLE